MKKQLLVFMVMCFGASFAQANKGIYKLGQAMAKINSEKVKEALKLAGQLDPEEKRKFLTQAEEMVVTSEKLTMTKWDWAQVIIGGVLALNLLVAVAPDELLVQFYRRPPGKEISLNSVRLKNACWGALGIALFYNGWRCRAARARLEECIKIQELLEGAPQKSFNAVQSTHTKK